MFSDVLLLLLLTTLHGSVARPNRLEWESVIRLPSEPVGPDVDETGTRWAVLVAGSNGYGNYRHQADVCHAYQLLIKGGVKEENIVVFMYDDIANNELNPRPGVIINHPQGPNVYDGVPKDYTGDYVTAENLYAVILGDKSKVRGGSGKVINSKAEDRIFIYYSDHGGPGVLGMPNMPYVYAMDFIDVLNKKHASRGYKKMVIYVEACESGSVFEGIMPKDINVYVTTASNAQESSWGTYCPGVDPAPPPEYITCLGDLYSVADLLIFVASVTARSLCEETDSYFIDVFGKHCLSIFKSLGLPSTAIFVRDLPTELKQRNELKKVCTSSLASEFPEDCKFYPADTKDDLHKFLSLFKEQRLKTPHWRTQRPYLTTNKVDAVYDGNSDKCTLVLSGYLRARNLSVNQLVHVSGAGDFQLGKIEVLKDPFALNSKKKQDLMDSDEMHDQEVIRSLVPDPEIQESLVVENTPDLIAGEQTWPTEAEMAQADEDRKQKKLRKRKLPAGTSEYQAAWIVDESDEEQSDCDNEDDMMLDEVNGFPGQEGNKYVDLDGDGASLRFGDSEDETDNDSVMMEVDNMTTEKIQDELKELKEAHAADEEYPDEVDTPLDVPARKRFAKYRGLKSFRTSSWDPKESLPQDYAKIFEFDNFKRTQKHVHAKALEWEDENREDNIPVGSYARLHIKEVPSIVVSKLRSLAQTTPVTTCGLLKHESKVSVLHFSVKKHETYDAPIKSKEELIFHVGFRQFVGRPTFSSEFINTDKNKMERFLHAGRFSVASIYAPISFPPLPTIVLKTVGDGAAPVVAAVGSLKTVDPDRIILKRLILTGYPQRVSKRKASVRHMFYNPEDVKWFKPVEIYTKRGLRGRIKEPVGTHGAMKCLLNGVLAQSDTVCLNLFKRSYPKWPTRYFPLLD